ncbi:molybdopterin molybdotransferase MoeA [Burkholderia ubonensis]|uniref:molybdopterin molybdotransferase MoeA n=1 Tax=Burkholderia ubonensis TaxID=101571 RepID=UPI000F58DE40|nr:gephyrin-like molybdotransferase Glp [Burkholderia ubonensis]RQP29036.1 molybdopterin molybdenumtransferase MoeA [Burkholderia ubonensis]RQP43554.1 molybdopterin molybdenumtransferase MoeA [Burkholderia ubonensis]RQP46341.1 molybdopterin molybdenumtransferase MoeA [Burkholderia ubonensis]RQP59672.1 molybdopterin molybdenumtransferase MoeA [Burkholderia ubonensis]RQP65733.1 molybdopterin molybdenumtransferase MoeA [Burkholderia ubonensis]
MSNPNPAAPRAPMLSTAEALGALLDAATPLAGAESVATLDALGRVLATDVESTLDVPPMHTSAMDGYAVRVADLMHGDRRLPVSQRIPAGHPAAPLAAGTAARIFTGATVPPGADAVVMQEQTEADGDAVEILHTPKPGEWITAQGADIRRGAVILPAGTRLTPQALGLAASVGCAQLSVARRIKVAVFFTGDELTMPGEPLKPGAIYNSNRFTLRGLLERLGCHVTDYGIVPDSLAATRDTLREAARDHDVILTSGGVSVGDEDHVKPAVEAEGRLALWQIAMKPGKPLAFGAIRRGDSRPDAHFIGLPGNPVSSFVTFLLFVRPFLLRLSGVRDVAPRALSLRADFTQGKSDRRNEFLRARINSAGGLDLFPNQSSAVLTSTVWGDGLIDNPPYHAISAGETVRFLPFSELLS